MVSQPRSVQSSLWDGAIFLIIPGTSCLATIVLCLRYKDQAPQNYLSAYGVETLGWVLQSLWLWARPFEETLHSRTPNAKR